MRDFPSEPPERVCGIVVHKELDNILHELGYFKLEDNEWEALKLLPPSEPDAQSSPSCTSDALQQHRGSAPDDAAGGAL